MDFVEKVEAEARGRASATTAAASGGGGDGGAAAAATAAATATAAGDSSGVGDGAGSKRPKAEKKKPVVCIIMGMAVSFRRQGCAICQFSPRFRISQIRRGGARQRTLATALDQGAGADITAHLTNQPQGPQCTPCTQCTQTVISHSTVCCCG